MLLSDFRFSHQFRVRWSETDAQGVVFNARYLDYGDIAITEYWRAVGFRVLYPELPLEFHVARATVNFRKPIKPDEMITVTARTVATGRSSLTQLVAIFGADGNDDLRAEIELVSVHVDLATHKSARLPDFLGDCFKQYDAGLALEAL
jgi:acyl-CoA thioester hydrolase